jgi:hypothetical protein
VLKVKFSHLKTIHILLRFFSKFFCFFLIRYLWNNLNIVILQILLNKLFILKDCREVCLNDLNININKTLSMCFKSFILSRLIRWFFNYFFSFKLCKGTSIDCNTDLILWLFSCIYILNLKLIKSQIKYWHTIRYIISFKLINNDLRLLNREFIYFISTFSNTLNFIKQLVFTSKKKKISILRSPFIYNKSYEQFELIQSKLSVKTYNKFNILFYNYFIIWNFILFRYSILKVNKIIL